MEKIGEVKGKGNRKEIDIKGKIEGNGKIERKRGGFGSSLNLQGYF